MKNDNYEFGLVIIAMYIGTSIILILLMGKFGKKNRSIHWKIIYNGGLIFQRWNSHLTDN